MVSRILLLKLHLIVVELLILETQLLELLSEVVLSGEGGPATPILEGGGAGGSSIIHILGMDLLISRTLGNLRQDLLWDLRLRKPLDPHNTPHFSKQVHFTDRKPAKGTGVSLLCAPLQGYLEVVFQVGDEGSAVEFLQLRSTLVEGPRHHRAQVEGMIPLAHRLDEVHHSLGDGAGTV
ncbi:unnamed protein product [Linum trigynum]|uniref:Secreted protein n=1 Tax=Linum trigynum TaxID=586398 RepID=A0AAV2GNP4_9ROSI